MVDKFTYFGNTLSRRFAIDDEINARLAKASVALDRFSKTNKNPVWNRRYFTIETKINVHPAVGLTLWV